MRLHTCCGNLDTLTTHFGIYHICQNGNHSYTWPSIAVFPREHFPISKASKASFDVAEPHRICRLALKLRKIRSGSPASKSDRPFHHFRTSRLGDRWILAVQERRATDFEASKLWQGRSEVRVDRRILCDSKALIMGKQGHKDSWRMLQPIPGDLRHPDFSLMF